MQRVYLLFFFFNDTATTEIYTLSLHDALPIYDDLVPARGRQEEAGAVSRLSLPLAVRAEDRSEEHTSELQSPCNLVCRLLLEKKKKKTSYRESFFTPRRCESSAVPSSHVTQHR